MEDLISIIEKCIKAKNEKGYSYEYLADQTGISKSTIERIFKTKGAGCRYDSVAPIANFLACVDEPTPSSPKALEAQNPLGTNEMIDWYKEIIKERREENERLKAENIELNDRLKAVNKELREEFNGVMAENKREHAIQIKGLKRNNAWLVVAVIGLTILIFLALILDIFVLTNKGWFIK